MEARDERRLLKLQRELAAVKLLIVDELGYVPLSATGAELLFEVLSQRYERGSTIITSNLPFEDWTQVPASERLTGALLDRLTHHVSILTMNGGSYRLKQSAGGHSATLAGFCSAVDRRGYTFAASGARRRSSCLALRFLTSCYSRAQPINLPVSASPHRHPTASAIWPKSAEDGSSKSVPPPSFKADPGCA